MNTTQIYVEKRNASWQTHPMLFEIVKETEKKITVRPVHRTLKAETMKIEDFEARFTPRKK